MAFPRNWKIFVGAPGMQKRRCGWKDCSGGAVSEPPSGQSPGQGGCWKELRFADLPSSRAAAASRETPTSGVAIVRPLTKGRSSLLTARSASASGREFGGWNAQDVQVSVPVCLSPREGNGNLLQDSCLENPMDRGTWWAAVHGVTKSQT